MIECPCALCNGELTPPEPEEQETSAAVPLENWYALGDLALGKCRLVGIAHNHPDLSAPHEVWTTIVVSADGRFVTTKSGTVYRLGRPHPDFLKAVEEPIDEEKPFGI